MELTLPRQGLMLALSSPSGAGKSTIARALLERDPHITMSVSCTTRPPRLGEMDGRDYHFIGIDLFLEMMEGGQFLEHARVFDNFYGTPRGPVGDTLASGRDVLLDIDWQGTQQLCLNVRADLVTVFILPPSMEELEQRLRTRAQDGDEMDHWFEYDYILLNTEVERSVTRVQAILDSERLKRDRQIGMAAFVNRLRGR
ncbi:MAG: guanylate kinase [Phaeospirillum sp.]|nr:guanylate kinase [Phaeospirillum sp.]